MVGERPASSETSAASNLRGKTVAREPPRTEHLHAQIANERKDRLALVAPIVTALGHEVIAHAIEVDHFGAVTARERPDVAPVGLGESPEDALGLIEKIVREAACPGHPAHARPDPAFVKEASKRGIFASISDAEAEDSQSSIDIVLHGSPSTGTSKERSDAGRRIERA